MPHSVKIGCPSGAYKPSVLQTNTNRLPAAKDIDGATAAQVMSNKGRAHLEMLSIGNLCLCNAQPPRNCFAATRCEFPILAGAERMDRTA